MWYGIPDEYNYICLVKLRHWSLSWMFSLRWTRNLRSNVVVTFQFSKVMLVHHWCDAVINHLKGMNGMLVCIGAHEVHSERRGVLTNIYAGTHTGGGGDLVIYPRSFKRNLCVHSSSGGEKTKLNSRNDVLYDYILNQKTHESPSSCCFFFFLVLIDSF